MLSCRDRVLPAEPQRKARPMLSSKDGQRPAGGVGVASDDRRIPELVSDGRQWAVVKAAGSEFAGGRAGGASRSRADAAQIAASVARLHLGESAKRNYAVSSMSCGTAIAVLCEQMRCGVKSATHLRNICWARLSLAPAQRRGLRPTFDRWPKPTRRAHAASDRHAAVHGVQANVLDRAGRRGRSRHGSRIVEGRSAVGFAYLCSPRHPDAHPQGVIGQANSCP